MAEASRPSFKCFETEWKGILAWLEPTALEDIHFVSGEHISGLKVLHFKISILRSPNVFGAMIVASILL